jgi:hypothetical protein
VVLGGIVRSLVCLFDLSRQIRPNQPSCVQLVTAVGVGMPLLVFSLVFAGGSSPSRHPPNQPGYSHEEVDVGFEDVVVAVGAGLGVVLCEDEDDVVVFLSPLSSLQPNQPGVLHVDVEDDEEDDVFDEVLVPVVDSSRQPHQPGVLHVSVRVRVVIFEEVVGFAVGFEVREVVVSVPLDSKYFQV